MYSFLVNPVVLVEACANSPYRSVVILVRLRNALSNTIALFGLIKVIEEGGVLSIPLEELRMEKPPRPDRSGQVVFKEKKVGNQIDNYPVVDTIDNMNALIRDKYEEVKKTAKAAGKSESEAEILVFAEATKVPKFRAVKYWQDTMIKR